MQAKIQRVSLFRYVWSFILASLLSQLVIILFATIAGTTYRASGIVAAMIAALWVSEKFVERQGRAFETGEKWRMILYSLLGLLFITATSIGILIAPAWAATAGYLTEQQIPAPLHSFALIQASQDFRDFLMRLNPVLYSYIGGFLALLYAGILYVIYTLFPPRLVRKHIRLQKRTGD